VLLSLHRFMVIIVAIQQQPQDSQIFLKKRKIHQVCLYLSYVNLLLSKSLYQINQSWCLHRYACPESLEGLVNRLLLLKMGFSNSNGSYLAALVYGLHADTIITELCIQNCADVINLNRLNHDVLCRLS
jgi:hypothetical protein